MKGPLENAREVILLEEAERRANRDGGELDRLWVAMMLAPNLTTCIALLRGETVPLARLDQKWVQRLGLRATNGR
jgi:hypothetical protein